MTTEQKLRKEREAKVMGFAEFVAGWNAKYRLEAHEWGPSPPKTPEDAFVEWKNTCDNGHLTFKIIRPIDCKACKQLIQRGRFRL